MAVEQPHEGSRASAAAQRRPPGRRIVDLSHPIEAGMTTYPGLPGPDICEHLSRASSRSHYAGGTEFAIHRVTMVGNTGTYLDSPFHRYPGGADLAGLSLDGLVDLPAVVVHLSDAPRPGIDAPSLVPFEVAGCAVLLQTGWDRHWRTDAYGAPDAPFLTEGGAAWLVAHGARLVGIDSVNIDDVADLRRPAHSTLLAAGVPIVEHLTNLDALPAGGARFHAAPPAFRGLSTIAVRAYAILPD